MTRQYAKARTWQQRLHDLADVKGPEDCWIWQGCTDRGGYGLFTGERGHPIPYMSMAHRWSYYAAVGPVPDGLELDHLCNVRACINPAHLEPVTRQENQRRRSERQTHCKWGHEFTDQNTYIHATSGARVCRRCQANRQRAHAARKGVAA